MARVDKTSDGILYVVLFELEGKQLVKIGVTHRRIEDRVSEILISMFHRYREFPYARPRRFTKTPNPYKKEKQLHKHFSKYSYKTSKKFGGSTEFFDIPVDEVIEKYDEVVKSKSVKPRKKRGVFFTTTSNV